jgi:hypothetical protein
MLFELRQRRQRTGASQSWHGQVRSAFPPEAAPLLKLVPSRRAALYLDVLTEDADEGFELIRHTPSEVMAADVQRITALNIGPVPIWLHKFAAGDDHVRTMFDHALRRFHSMCLTPHWLTASRRFHDDVAHRTDTMRRFGVTAMIDGLSPELRVHGSTLVGQYPWHRQIRLDGRGLVLMPSAFWTGHPLLTWDPQQHSRHVLIYPARSSTPGATPGEALDALLGRTRAAALRVLRAPTTTSGLAARLHTSIASASKHATTLRNAGLVSTSRRGAAVEHQLTELGCSLLHGHRTSPR